MHASPLGIARSVRPLKRSLASHVYKMSCVDANSSFAGNSTVWYSTVDGATLTGDQSRGRAVLRGTVGIWAQRCATVGSGVRELYALQFKRNCYAE